ncbi:MAG TPA: class II aldolase/adducin family protein [Anaerolineae bacterium]|nr:class II aldolase/adducin family protein [Anaerolineae bacterium]
MSEADIQQEIIRVCRILEGKGLVEGFGHVSVRLNAETMLITPARGLRLVEAADLLVFDLSGQIKTGRLETAPLERWLHLAIYQTRPDLQAICRTHSPMAAALGVANQPLRPAHGFGAMLGAEVRVHPDNDLITDLTMGQNVATSLGAQAGLLLRGNGSLACGASLPEACVRAIYLEEAAWLQVTAAKIGGAVPFTLAEMKARARWHAVELERAWEYYSTKFAGEKV